MGSPGRTRRVSASSRYKSPPACCSWPGPRCSFGACNRRWRRRSGSTSIISPPPASLRRCNATIERGRSSSSATPVTGSAPSANRRRDVGGHRATQRRSAAGVGGGGVDISRTDESAASGSDGVVPTTSRRWAFDPERSGLRHGRSPGRPAGGCRESDHGGPLLERPGTDRRPGPPARSGVHRGRCRG